MKNVSRETLIKRGLIYIKNKYYDFINGFSKIKVSSILKKAEVFSSNFYTKKVSSEKLEEIKKEIDKQIIKLYNDFVGDDGETKKV